MHSIKRDKLIQNKNIILSERKISAELRGIYIEITEKWRGKENEHTGTAGLALHPTHRPFTSACSVCLSSGLRIPFFILMNMEESCLQRTSLCIHTSLCCPSGKTINNPLFCCGLVCILKLST